MQRRECITLAAAGAVSLAGCTASGDRTDGTGSGSGPGTTDDGETDASTDTPTPDPTAGPPGADGDETATPEQTPDGAAAGSAETVTFEGDGPTTTERFTAAGGPVILGLRHEPERGNFILYLLDGTGERTDLLVSKNGSYDGRVIKALPAGDYFVEVWFANGPWAVTVEQPGVPARGESLPVSVEGTDADVVGPLQFDGLTRIEFESVGPTGYSANRVTFVAPTGEERGQAAFAGGTEPTSTSGVFDASGPGFLQVEAAGTWRMTARTA